MAALGSALALVLAAVPAYANNGPEECPPENEHGGGGWGDDGWGVDSATLGGGDHGKRIKVIVVCICPTLDATVSSGNGHRIIFCCPPLHDTVSASTSGGDDDDDDEDDDNGREAKENGPHFICPCPPFLGGPEVTRGGDHGDKKKFIVVFICPYCVFDHQGPMGGRSSDDDDDDGEESENDNGDNGDGKGKKKPDLIVIVCPCPENGQPPAFGTPDSRRPHVKVVFKCPPPECPENLTAEAEGDGDIFLDWDAPNGQPDSYRIYRSEEGGPFLLLDSVSGGTTSYTDTSSVPGVTYRYKVTSVDNGKESKRCPSVEVTAVPFFGGAVGMALAGLGGVGALVAFRRRQA